MQAGTKITISTLRRRKREGEKFAVLTCYDSSTARIMCAAGVDVILVGDTYGEVCLGHSTTLPVSMDQLVTVTAGVRRGAPTAFIIGDMPFLSYQVCDAEAIRNAGRFMIEAGCDCVKLEVNGGLAGTVEALSRASIPVMAHLGLRPQSIHQMGGYKVQGRTAEEARVVIDDARRMEECGAVALLLEAVPIEVARIISESTELPVVGCVAGSYCDGTVVVMHDMLGFGEGHPPSGIKQYAQMNEVLTAAFVEYARDVREGKFPGPSHGVPMAQEEWDRLVSLLPG